MKVSSALLLVSLATPAFAEPFEGKWSQPQGACNTIITQKEWRTKVPPVLREPDEVCPIKSVKQTPDGYELTMACRDRSGDGPSRFAVTYRLTNITADKLTWKPGKDPAVDLTRCK
jgi:hypothetical protein